MRLSAPRISKAIAALALIAVASLIAVSLLADAGSASAWMEERRGHLGEYNQSDETDGVAFDIEENKTAAAGETLIRVGKVKIRDRDDNVLDTKYIIHQDGSQNPIVDGNKTFQLNPHGKDSGDNKNVLWVTGPLNHEKQDTYLLVVSADGTVSTAVTVIVTILDLNEPPMLGVSPTVLNAEATPMARTLLPTGDDIPNPEYAANITESADMGDVLLVSEWDGTSQFAPPRYYEDHTPIMAFDEDAGAVLTYSLRAANSSGAMTTSAFSGPFSINASTGAITVSGTLDYETTDEYVMYIVVTDDDAQTPLSDNAKLTINVIDINELPAFVRDDLDRMSAQEAAAYCKRDWDEIRLVNPPIITIDENPNPGMVLVDYDACDAEGDDLRFIIWSGPELDSKMFYLNEATGVLSVSSVAADAAKFDYESKASYSVEVEVVDHEEVGQGQILQEIRLNDVNENITRTPTHTPAPTATPTPVPGAGATPTPTTTPARVSQDVLHRVGALEQLLATLQTLIQSLQGVIAAQDGKIAAQDDRIAAQDNRIATLEAQMSAGALTPTPTATPSPRPLPTSTPSPTPTDTPEPTPASNASACVQAMQPGSVSGSWNSACLTANPTHGNTYYARFYTFTLAAAADVTITLTSDKPPYLYLLAGGGTSGDILQETGEGGQTSATITDTLRAGSYTIEATTWNSKTLGDFTLTLSVRE